MARPTICLMGVLCNNACRGLLHYHEYKLTGNLGIKNRVCMKILIDLVNTEEDVLICYKVRRCWLQVQPG